MGESQDIRVAPEISTTRHRIVQPYRKFAAHNRKHPAQPERILWSLLRKSQLGGLKFRRQTTIGRYIVDFCCPSRKLVIEVDGETHVGRGVEDDVRTNELESFGYRVLRVTNDDVLTNLDAVGLYIMREAGLEIYTSPNSPAPHPPPRPLPQREGE